MTDLFEKIQQNPDKLEEESFYTKALTKYLVIKKEHPTLIDRLKGFPSRIKTAKKFNENELLVFFKKGRLYIHGIKQDKDNLVYQTTFEEIFDRIVCSLNEPKMELSDNFWGSYEKVKKHKESRSVPVSEQSVEQTALNNLKTFISKPWEGLIPRLDFLRTLREDILDYGTLSDYTMRRIANLEGGDKTGQNKSVLEIVAIKNELGVDYLQREKERQKDLVKEIIIAIENRKI